MAGADGYEFPCVINTGFVRGNKLDDEYHESRNGKGAIDPRMDWDGIEAEMPRGYYTHLSMITMFLIACLGTYCLPSFHGYLCLSGLLIMGCGRGYGF